MQTFLPYPDFDKSAQSLDMMRLGKQRVETFQILQKLVEERLVTSYKVPTGRTRLVATGQTTPEGKPVFREDPILKKIDLPRDQWTRESTEGHGWTRHPAKVMWEGHALALLEYQRAVCREWVRRGYKDSCWVKSVYLLAPHRDRLLALGEDALPAWHGRDDFHASHQANLVRKAPDFYTELFPTADPEAPYIWPHHELA